MREANKVWLASFHMIVIAQQQYYMLETQCDRRQGGCSQLGCLQGAMRHQHFGSTLCTNYLADLA
jgi:hypothetical protein